MLLTIETLQKLKERSRLSYREIAEKSGVPIGTVQKVLGGITRSPRRDTLEALAAVLADPGIAVSEDSSDSNSEFSYRESISYDDQAASRSEVHEAEHVYGEPDNDEGHDNQLDDMVERLIDSKKSGEFTVDDYYVISEKYRIELIDGVIYDMAAPKLDHQHIAGIVYTQLMNYHLSGKEKCLPGIAPIDVQLDKDDKTIVQPDVIVLCKNLVKDNKVVYGAPDFVMEVFSPSTRFKDRVIKREKYKAAGCREYWMVDPLNKRVTVLDLEHNLDGIYTFDQKVPVRISGGKYEVDFSLIENGLNDLRHMGLI